MLPYPAKVWHVKMEGVKLVHVTTGKVLAVTENKYPEWGENMTEVVTTDPTQSGQHLWTEDFIRYPKFSQYKKPQMCRSKYI